jgi:hypothetical protein
MKRVYDKPYLWTGSLCDLKGPIGYINNKNDTFAAWAGCAFLHNDMQIVRGLCYQDTWPAKLNHKYIYPEVRVYARAWVSLKVYLTAKYSGSHVHISLERKIADNLNNFEKRMDALVVVKENDAKDNILHLIVIECKYANTDDDTFIASVATLLEYYNALTADPYEYVDNSLMRTDGCTFVVHPPVMLFDHSCAIIAEYYRDVHRNKLPANADIICFEDTPWQG